ncbi:MAG: ATP phosphoribosyltransferase [Coriobacteriia bacterium]|nr:ATP phosphoribosyltransferase [Coriobacteriia bacterium]
MNRAKQAFPKPRGFRDVLFTEAAQREALSACVGAYFADAGYELVETPSVEYLETLRRGTNSPDLELSDTFRFVDVDGRLLTLQNDVTIPLARVVASRFTLLPPPYRLRYRADVFREQESLRGSERQFTQLGIECFGLPQSEGDSEVLLLALGGLRAAGCKDFALHLSDVGVIRALLDAASDQDAWRASFDEAWYGGDFIRVTELINASALPTACKEAFVRLLALRGGLEALDEATELLAAYPLAGEALARIRANYQALADAGYEREAKIDFSLLPAFDYYSGMVFELYAMTAGGNSLVLGSGGRYDSLMQQFDRELPAAGFVYDLSQLESAASNNERSGTASLLPLKIAIPKGKLYADSVALLEQAGVSVPGLDDPGRTLRFRTDQFDVIIAKPSDVAIYVSRGAADVGIGGRDILVEADFPLLQLCDLRFGACEFVVAAPDSCPMTLDEMSLELGTVRVATKYPRLAQHFFDSRGIQVEIVKLNGNIELGPLIGISDVIVDITQTGQTLRENNLRVLERVLPSTARFVANAVAARTDERVAALATRLGELVGQ